MFKKPWPFLSSSYHPPIILLNIILLKLALNVNASTVKISNICPHLYTFFRAQMSFCTTVGLRRMDKLSSSNSAFSGDPLVPTSPMDRELQDHYGFYFLTHVPPFDNLNEFLSQPARPSVAIHCLPLPQIQAHSFLPPSAMMPLTPLLCSPLGNIESPIGPTNFPPFAHRELHAASRGVLPRVRFSARKTHIHQGHGSLYTAAPCASQLPPPRRSSSTHWKKTYVCMYNLHPWEFRNRGSLAVVSKIHDTLGATRIGIAKHLSSKRQQHWELAQNCAARCLNFRPTPEGAASGRGERRKTLRKA